MLFLLLCCPCHAARAVPCCADLNQAQQARHLVHVQAVVLSKGAQQLAPQLVVQQNHLSRESAMGRRKEEVSAWQVHSSAQARSSWRRSSSSSSTTCMGQAGTQQQGCAVSGQVGT